MALAVKGLEAALIRYLALKEGIRAVEITSLDDTADDYQGGCPTCYSGPDYSAEVWYRVDGDSREHCYTYSGHMSELISSLTD